MSLRKDMLKNFLVIALRNLRRQKRYSFINITGLAVGRAASFFILLWVQDELRHDRFLKAGDRIHVVLRNVNIGDDVYTWRHTSKPLVKVLDNDTGSSSTRKAPLWRTHAPVVRQTSTRSRRPALRVRCGFDLEGGGDGMAPCCAGSNNIVVVQKPRPRPVELNFLSRSRSRARVQL